MSTRPICTLLALTALCCSPTLFAQAQRGQPTPPVSVDNAQSLVRVQEAKTLAGNDNFLNFPLNFFCVPSNPRANDTNAPELEPIKLFDNLYAAGNSETTVYALSTPDGIVLLDAGYGDRVETVLVPGLQKLGLDPAKVRYILIAHGHADHFGGAKYFQDKYGTRLAAAAEDWDAIAPQNAAANQNRPKRDLVLADGQPFQFGGISITPVATPGHTPGSLAFIFPIKDNGVTRMAGLFGGAMLTMNRVTPDGLRQYVQSLDHFIDVAKKMNVEVEVQNHGIFDGMAGRLTQLQSRTAGAPNPFVVGADRYVKFWNIVERCFQAELARRN